MNAEQILELITIIAGFAFLLVCFFLFCKYVLPLIHEESKEENVRQLIKARTELRLKKKQIKILEQELKYYESNYPEFATEDEWNNYLSNQIEDLRTKVDKLDKKQRS